MSTSSRNCLALIRLAAIAILACGAWGTVEAAADPDLEMAEQQALRSAVQRIAPSVVRIETIGGLQRVGRVVFGSGPTTGLIVDPEGYVISSAFNFVNRPASILVRLPGGALKQAELVATDHNRMLVLLKIDVDQPLPVPRIVPQKQLRVGQWAIAVGRTFDGNRPNMSAGVLSGLDRIWGKALQTDAAVSPNNYGGPLVDIRGRLLGVLVPLSAQSAEEVAGVEWYDSGIGFAIPAEHVMKILPRLKKGEDLRPGLLGISLKGHNPAVSEAVIAALHPKSPASGAGIEKGDRIVEIEGRKIGRAADVKQELGRRYAGAKIRLALLRDKERIEREVTLVAELPPLEHPFLGILPLRDPPGKDEPQPPGVAVRYVYPKSPAARAGIHQGDAIIQLGETPLTAAGQFRALLSTDYRVGEEIELKVRRGGDTLALKLSLASLPEALPPKDLPPARAAGGPDSSSIGAAKPQEAVGIVPLKIPELKNDARAYVPTGYDPAVPHGLLVWLHGSGRFDFEEVIARWKPHCDRHDLILLTPKSSDPAKWQPGEAGLVRKLLDEINSTYTIDPSRIAVCGRQGGGRLAYLVAFRNPRLIRAAAVVDAPLSGRPPENEALWRLAVYLAEATKSSHAAANEASVARLRKMKIPVTLKALGEDPRRLTPDETAELVRWIDMLDRI